MSTRSCRFKRIQFTVYSPKRLCYVDFRYNDKVVYVIDVSQSVEHDHPRSLEFLRMDIKNITDFFRKKGVITLQERTAFEFITAENLTVDREEIRSVIDKLIQEDQEKPVEAEVD